MAEGHNTSLPPSRAQALSSSPSKTKTKAEEELFVLKMVEENVAPRRRSARQQVPKVHVQTGRFRPVSDRYPHGYPLPSFCTLLLEPLPLPLACLKP